MRFFSLPLTCAAAAATLACNNPAPPAEPGTPDARVASSSDRYIPLSVGAKWTYNASDPLSGATGQTQSTVDSFGDVGGAKAGTMAFHITSTTLTGSTVNWQQDLGTSIVRQREEFFDISGLPISDYTFMPSRLRLDESPEHTVQGATWTETHTANVDNIAAGTTATASFSVTWTVEAVDESVTVPAGTFSCIRVHRVQTGYASSDEVHWFAKHVGKVKETGPEPKDLTSYYVPSRRAD